MAVLVAAMVFGISSLGQASRIDHVVSHRIGEMDVYEPADCPPSAPAGAVCQKRTHFHADYTDVESDRPGKSRRNMPWLFLVQMCVNGVCEGEKAWDMATAPRHQTKMADPRGFITKRLEGPNGYRVRFSCRQIPGTVENFDPPRTDLPHGACVKERWKNERGWTSECTGVLTVKPPHGRKYKVTGVGHNRYHRVERHTVRIDGCTN